MEYTKYVFDPAPHTISIKPHKNRDIIIYIESNRRYFDHILHVYMSYICIFD